jgi:branched-chain amino acid transport system substrate-binding protein
VNKFTVKIAGAMLLAGVLFAGPAWAQKKYDAGASDTEIKIGNVSPYTGWAKDYGAVGRAEAAYFRMVNERGGVNGRKINFVSEDLGAASGAEIAER